MKITKLHKYFFVFLLLINILGFVLAGFDKQQAVKDKQRVAEVNLIAVSSFGGAIGTYLGFKVWHHKTSSGKSYLRRALFLVFVENMILISAVIFSIKCFNEKKNPE